MYQIYMCTCLGVLTMSAQVWPLSAPPPTPTQDRFEVFAPQFWHERAAFQSVGIWAVDWQQG